MLGTWPCPEQIPGNSCDELAICCDTGGDRRVLVLPALFEEANKLRHFTVEVMRELQQRGVTSVLPDLAGCNESLQVLGEQTMASWQDQARAAASHFNATHILTIRGGALLDPGHLPGVRYAPIEGLNLLRGMLRTRVISDKEAGMNSDRDTLLEQGKAHGLTLAGYRLGPAMIAQLADALPPHSMATQIAHSAVGGGALWLRAEPAHEPQQAAKLATLVADETG